jgi:hypothetical protein
MDTRLIVVLVDAAVVALALLVLGGKKAKAKRRGPRGELRRKARHQRMRGRSTGPVPKRRRGLLGSAPSATSSS